MSECKHTVVERRPAFEEWRCSNPHCKRAFFPDHEGMPTPESFTVALDAIAGTMSAVLFDYSERMNEKYGLKPQETEAAPEKPCADGHDRDSNGICRVCNDNPFL